MEISDKMVVGKLFGGATKIIGSVFTALYVAGNLDIVTIDNTLPEPYKTLGRIGSAGLLLGIVYSFGSGIKDLDEGYREHREK